MDPFIGEVTMFAGNFAPRGWAFCDGQLLAVASNSALFSILGTIYGGDGRTTFALPDLRGRFPIGPGNGPGLSSYREGQRGGTETHTLSVAEMPTHGHSPSLHAEQAVGDNNVPADRMLGVAAAGNNIYATFNAADDIAMSPHSITETPAGGNQAFNHMNPFLSLHFIIALQGVYPSRS
ncbi:tail fiber protein [Octadecabacter sp. G9-8]|uniref:Tail fiber protein n=1 Tax=Octadecabacter dasysiphoniae TaxID=2909341 RepID=A0ABS9CYY0_9RHOB|nr:tail fiber protein [Octadecabacter dasysiphoniae]MCF2872368.1 tail fiber protein [Octadecabacter dasysiphoniae]